jgi:tryptophan synthase beta chain
MHTLGYNFMPPHIHTGGLLYHGAGPLVSQLLKDCLKQARAVHQKECFEAVIKFACAEGIIPAPETNYAIVQIM